jgi:hypothetical protein
MNWLRADEALNMGIKICADITTIYASFGAIYIYQGRTQGGVTRTLNLKAHNG